MGPAEGVEGFETSEELRRVFYFGLPGEYLKIRYFIILNCVITEDRFVAMHSTKAKVFGLEEWFRKEDCKTGRR